MSDERPRTEYRATKAEGTIRVAVVDGQVTLNVFGTYAALDPEEARSLADDINDLSYEAEGAFW